MKNDPKAHLALFTVSLIYGLNYTVAKDVMPDFIQPFGFIFLRVSGALVLFWIAHTLFSRERIKKADVPRLILCGFFGVAANQLLFFSGLNLSNPINTSIIMTFIPIAVMLASAVLLKERIGRTRVIGIAVGMAGALTQILGRGDTAFSEDTFWGDLLVWVNAGSYGIYLVIVKPLMAKYSPLTVITWVFTFGFVFVLPVGFSQFQEIEWASLPNNIILNILYVVLATTVLAYLLNIYALKKVSPTVVGVYTYLQPLLAAGFAILLRGDMPQWTNFASAGLIFMGVYLVSKK